MNVRFTLLWLFCAALTGILSCSPKPFPSPQTAFYFWQTVYRPDTAGLRYLGFELDPAANAAAGPCISRGDGPSAWVIATNEELAIARHMAALLRPGRS